MSDLRVPGKLHDSLNPHFLPTCITRNADPFSNKLRERGSIVSLHLRMCDCHEAYKKGIRHLRVLLGRLLVVTHLQLFPASIPNLTPWHPRRFNKTKLYKRRTKSSLKRIHHWSLMSIISPGNQTEMSKWLWLFKRSASYDECNPLRVRDS